MERPTAASDAAAAFRDLVEWRIETTADLVDDPSVGRCPDRTGAGS